MYIYLELSLHFATQNSRVTLSWSDGLFFLSAFTHFLFLTANPLGSVIYKSTPLSWIWASVSQICWRRVCFLDISLHIRGRDELFCLRTEIDSLPHGKKGFGNLLKINFLHKNDSRQKQYSSSPLLTWKCCCLQGKLGKHAKFVTFFVSRSLARERRLISGCHWFSRKYVSVFAGDPGYMIAYIPAIFFQT